MTHALARPFPRSLLVALGAALAGGLIALALIGLVRLDGAQGRADFSISVPHGWKATTSAQAAVLRSADRGATVVVRRSGELHGSLRAIARELTTRLAARVRGFRLIGARVARVRAGAAFVYTFAFRGAAQSITVTKVAGATYRIDSVVRPGSPQSAREAAAAVASFGP
jgi:hypothetical protein